LTVTIHGLCDGCDTVPCNRFPHFASRCERNGVSTPERLKKWRKHGGGARLRGMQKHNSALIRLGGPSVSAHLRLA
jgi:hypothetical protein